MLSSNQRLLSYQANALTTVLLIRICLIAYGSLTIQNNIYLFVINSRKIDEYYQSWIEYLNEHNY